jgi:hypothetical protein
VLSVFSVVILVFCLSHYHSHRDERQVMPERLTREERLRIYHDVCRRPGRSRVCREAREAGVAAEELVGPPQRMTFSSDYVLMRAIDRFCAGELSLEELYRCRILAYVMIFGEGGEEWRNMGVAMGVRVGDGTASEAPPDLAEDDLLEP